MTSTKQIEFPIPKGFVAPEGTNTGEDFDLVCTFRLKPGGKTMCMVQLGDLELPGYSDSDESKPGYGEYAKGMMEQGDNMTAGT